MSVRKNWDITLRLTPDDYEHLFRVWLSANAYNKTTGAITIEMCAEITLRLALRKAFIHLGEDSDGREEREAT